MIDAWITQLRKGLLEYRVITVISRGESYGYEIVAALGRMEEFSVSESTIYPILSRLRQEKFLKLRDVPPPHGHELNQKLFDSIRALPDRPETIRSVGKTHSE